MAGNRKRRKKNPNREYNTRYGYLPNPTSSFCEKYTSFYTQPFTMKEYIKRSRMINDFLFKCKPEKNPKVVLYQYALVSENTFFRHQID